MKRILFVFCCFFTATAFTTQASQYVGNPSADNGWSTTDAVSIFGHSGERDSGGAPESSRLVINTINGSGMDADNKHGAGVPHGSMAMFATADGGGGGASSPNPGTQQTAERHWVTYALDQAYDLVGIEIWNHNEVNYWAMGWSNIVVETSLNNGTDPSDWTEVYSGDLPLAPAGGLAPSESSLTINLGGTPVQYVSLVNTGIGTDANWNTAAWDTGTNVGLSEVRFLVPEPSTLALLGLGGLAIFLRRRR